MNEQSTQPTTQPTKQIRMGTHTFGDSGIKQRGKVFFSQSKKYQDNLNRMLGMSGKELAAYQKEQSGPVKTYSVK